MVRKIEKKKVIKKIIILRNAVSTKVNNETHEKPGQI
jgi:hypothetical protein